MRPAPLQHRQPLITIIIIFKLRFKVKNPTRSINVKPALVHFQSLSKLLTFYWSKLVIMAANAFSVCHINHFLRLHHVLRTVAFIEIQPLVFENDEAALPVCHSHVCACSFFEDPPFLIIIPLRIPLNFIRNIIFISRRLFQTFFIFAIIFLKLLGIAF